MLHTERGGIVMLHTERGGLRLTYVINLENIQNLLGKYLPEVSVIARSRRPRVLCDTGESGENIQAKFLVPLLLTASF